MAELESDTEILASAVAACRRLELRLLASLPEMQHTLAGRLMYGFVAVPAIASHRIHDFATAALALYRGGRVAPASTLTRSVFETTALLVYLLRKMRAGLEASDLREFGELAARSIWGSKIETTHLNAVQVFTAIDHLDAEYPGSRQEYEMLCELAHPNVVGMGGAYTKTSLPSVAATLGVNPAGMPMSAFGLSHLSIALQIIEATEQRWGSFRQQFAELAAALEPPAA